MSRNPIQQVTRSAPLSRAGILAALAIAALSLTTSPLHAGLRLEPVRGHFGIGMAQLFVEDAPGGSLSASGGIDYPVAPEFRLGIDLGYHLLGSRTVERGSLAATLDYSVFDAMLLAHWEPANLGPIGRVSFGPGLIHGGAELSASGAGAAFLDLPRDETVLGLGGSIVAMSSKPIPVRVGFELALRTAFLTEETWSMLSARLVFHY
jgi:hypothetical protein